MITTFAAELKRLQSSIFFAKYVHYPSQIAHVDNNSKILIFQFRFPGLVHQLFTRVKCKCSLSHVSSHISSHVSSHVSSHISCHVSSHIAVVFFLEGRNSAMQ